jgi:LPXTG-motif cell wall-anchored protein
VAYLGVFLLLVAAAALATFFVFLAARRFGLVQDPHSPEAEKRLGEMAVRVFLCLVGGSAYVILLARRSTRSWFTARRWRLLLLVLFALGSAIAFADPFHAVSHEDSWIRYSTAGALIVAGLVGLASSLRGTHPIPDRLFGFGFGALLVLAAADEVLQFHERIADRANTGEQDDSLTLLVALAGLLGLGLIYFVRRLDNRLGRLLREARYRMPLRFLTIAVIAFLFAMTLDSLDLFFQNALAGITSGGFWTAVADVVRLSNATEELLEYFTAVILLMLVGSLFSVEALGFGAKPAARATPTLATRMT